jgi:hypothetical protein
MPRLNICLLGNVIFWGFIAFSCHSEKQSNFTSGGDNFQFRVKNSANNAYSIDCAFKYNENYYDNSHVLSTTQPSYWSSTGSAWDLKYDRIDEGHAVGGRCETQPSDILQGILSKCNYLLQSVFFCCCWKSDFYDFLNNNTVGNGKFTASVYIHSNVASSDGVFTLALLNRDFKQSGEIDLLVVNIQDNTIKSGRPGSAFSMDLNSMAQKWIDIVMIKNDGRCSTTVYSDGNIIFDPQGTTHGCDLEENGQNYFVVNSRSRGGPYSSSSFVTVSSAGWEQD